MEHKLVKAFEEENNFNNAVITLTLNVNEVNFLYHHEVDLKVINSCKDVIKKYNKKINIKFIFVKDEETELDVLLDKDTIVDISASKYLSICLFEKAIKKKLSIIYLDEEENKIKWYKDRKKEIKELFKFNIQDLVKLGGGKITKKQMHENVDINDTKTVNAIKRTIEANIKKYSSFVGFVQRLNSYLSHRNISDSTYSLSKELRNKIMADDVYQRIKNFGLFSMSENTLTFMNKKIENMFRVSGAFLENYLYIILKESNLFDEVDMSCIIDFSSYYDEYPIVCEIDNMVVKNNHLLFISCKSNKVDNDALFEIKVHNYILGNKMSSAAICTLDDLNKTSPTVYLKAKELKISVVDQSAFINKEVPETILRIMNNTYKYERV